jgi:hypothetical protein
MFARRLMLHYCVHEHLVLELIERSYSIQLLEYTTVQVLILFAILDCIRGGAHLRCGIRRHLLKVRPLEVHANRKWVGHDEPTVSEANRSYRRILFLW